MPAKKPTALKVLEGQRGHRTKAELARQQNEPKPRPITPEKPPYLGEVGRNKWDELLPELELMGTLTIVDPDVLGGYCLCYERLVSVQAKLDADDLIVTRGTGGQMLNPLTAERKDALDGLLKFGAQLGVGALSRSRIEVQKKDDGKSKARQIYEANRRR